MSGHPSRKLEVFVLRVTLEALDEANGEQILNAIRGMLANPSGGLEPCYNTTTVSVSLQERHAYYGAKPRRKS